MGAWLARLGLLVVSLAGVAAAAELGLRLLGPPADPVQPIVREPPEPGLPELVGRDIYAPNVRGIRAGAFFRTNERGVRGPSHPPHPPPGVFRLIVAGDSVTMGAGVLEEEAYPGRLAALLEERMDGRFEVINLGLGGLDAQAVIGRLSRHARFYHPDLVVYGYTLNDIEVPGFERLYTREEKLEPAIRQMRWLRSPSRLVAFVLPRIESLRARLDPSRSPLLHEYLHNYRDDAPAWREVQRTLDRFAGLGRAFGVCPHLFVHSQLSELSFLHGPTPLYRRIQAAAEARGISVTQSLPFFRGRVARSLWNSAMDPHPNPTGHRILANALATGLEELPAYCWAPPRQRTPAVRQALRDVKKKS